MNYRSNTMNINNMEVKFKRFTPNAHIPQKATEKSAGYDLRVPTITRVKPGRQIIKLGFAIQLPDWHKAVVDPRSGFSSKGMEGYLGAIQQEDGSYEYQEQQRFDCDVIHGLIDCDYRGECGVIVNNHGCEFWLPAGARIAQMVITKYEDTEFVEVEDLDKTERGDGGFGHTGTN